MNRTQLANANNIALSVVEFSTGAMTGRFLDNGGHFINVRDVSWTDDSSVVLLYFDDNGYALLRFDADSLRESASPTLLASLSTLKGRPT